jgi:hypothetical protein
MQAQIDLGSTRTSDTDVTDTQQMEENRGLFLSDSYRRRRSLSDERGGYS